MMPEKPVKMAGLQPRFEANMKHHVMNYIELLLAILNFLNYIEL